MQKFLHTKFSGKFNEMSLQKKSIKNAHIDTVLIEPPNKRDMWGKKNIENAIAQKIEQRFSFSFFRVGIGGFY